MDIEKLCKRLEKINTIEGMTTYRNPDGPEASTRLRALASENERLRKALLRLQTGAAIALDALPDDQQEGAVGNFLAAIHRECCAGLSEAKERDDNDWQPNPATVEYITREIVEGRDD